MSYVTHDSFEKFSYIFQICQLQPSPQFFTLEAILDFFLSVLPLFDIFLPW